jgi:two-component system, OmpR family, phosphate regulon response regulator OmpR
MDKNSEPNRGQSRSAHVIVLGDEAELRNMLLDLLTDQGFDVLTVSSSARLYEELGRKCFDVLVLDAAMQPESGLGVCRRLRREGHSIRILMLTARDQVVDREAGRGIGADNYLAKPFLPQELFACLRAILGRPHAFGREAVDENRFLLFGKYRFDLCSKQLTKGGDLVGLSAAEARLLEALAATPNRPVSRENLLVRVRVHGRDRETSGRSIDVQVRRLRQIIEEEPSRPRYIRTVWGLGYILIAEASS